MSQQPLMGQGLLIIEASRSHSDKLHGVDILWTSDRFDSREFYRKTQHSQETDIQALGGIQTRNSSKLAAADLRFRPHGHCYLHCAALMEKKYSNNQLPYINCCRLFSGHVKRFDSYMSVSFSVLNVAHWLTYI